MRAGLKEKVAKALKEEFSGPKDTIVIRTGELDSLHLYVVSRKFQGMRAREKHHLLCSTLFRLLSKDEWGRITVAVALSPRQAQEYWPPIPEVNGR